MEASAASRPRAGDIRTPDADHRGPHRRCLLLQALIVCVIPAPPRPSNGNGSGPLGPDRSPRSLTEMVPVLCASFLDVEPGLVFWTLVTFVCLAVLLRWKAWGRGSLHAVEEREKRIQEAVETAKKDREESQRLLDEHRKLVGEARREGAESVRKALAEAEVACQDLLQKESARSAEEIVAQTKRRDRRAGGSGPEARLSSAVVDLAMDAAEKVMGEALSDPGASESSWSNTSRSSRSGRRSARLSAGWLTQLRHRRSPPTWEIHALQRPLQRRPPRPRPPTASVAAPSRPNAVGVVAVHPTRVPRSSRRRSTSPRRPPQPSARVRRHRRVGQLAAAAGSGEGARQQVPRQHPADRCRLPSMVHAASTTPTWSTVDGSVDPVRDIRRDHRHRAHGCLKDHRDGRAPSRAHSRR